MPQPKDVIAKIICHKLEDAREAEKKADELMASDVIDIAFMTLVEKQRRAMIILDCYRMSARLRHEAKQLGEN